MDSSRETWSETAATPSRGEAWVFEKSGERSLPAVQLLLKYLEAEGVKYVFGIPGGPLMPFYQGLHERDGIKAILAKHEEGAAFMADGYARMRRGLSACCVTTGPGCTNAATGIATSYADGVPVFLITAQISTSAFGRGAIQESTCFGVNVVEMFKPITKASLMLTRASKMGETVRYLLRTALCGKPGPVHLNIPADLAGQLVSDETIAPGGTNSSRSYFDRGAIKEAASLLLRARNPAILAGNGINLSGAYEELRRLAERMVIPVATTVKAKGAFPEDHILSLGVFGFAGSPRAEAYLLSGDVDVLLTAGTSLGEDATNGWDDRLKPKEALLQIDIDPQQFGNNYPARVSLIGDAKTVLTELTYQLEREMHWIEPSHRSLEDIRRFRAEHPRCLDEHKMESEAVPLKPQRLMKDLSEVIPKDAAVFCDVGNHMAWAFHYLKLVRPHSFFHSMGFSAMGYGCAACIGAKLAAPERPVIAIVGDASFAMNGIEAHTAGEYEIPIIWVVLNNGGHGMIYHGEKIQFRNRFHNSLFRKPMDLCKLAEAIGIQSRRVTRPGEICPVLKQALEEGRPVLIDAVVDREEVPPIGSRFESLNKFLDMGIKSILPDRIPTALR